MGIFSLFKGRKVGKLAEVSALGKGPLKQRVDVVRLELENGKPGVGLKVVTKSLISYQAVPVSLNKVSMAIYFDPPLANKIDPPFIV